MDKITLYKAVVNRSVWLHIATFGDMGLGIWNCQLLFNEHGCVRSNSSCHLSWSIVTIRAITTASETKLVSPHKSYTCFSTGKGDRDMERNMFGLACFAFFVNQPMAFRLSWLRLSRASVRSSNGESREWILTQYLHVYKRIVIHMLMWIHSKHVI